MFVNLLRDCSPVTYSSLLLYFIRRILLNEIKLLPFASVYNFSFNVLGRQFPFIDITNDK